MTAEAFKNWLKTVIDSPSFTIGKLDTSKTQTICVYSGVFSGANRPAIGNESGYAEKTIRILLRWGNNFAKAELKAQQLYNSLRNKTVKIGGKTTCIVCKYSEPVSLGTDDKGMYEFSVDLTLIFER